MIPASKSSGIPTGAELASVWLREIKEAIDESGFKEWVEQEEINESLPAEFYGEILAKRFEASRQEGYDYLEKIMENAEPSVGYSFLAAIMEKGRHNRDAVSALLAVRGVWLTVQHIWLKGQE